MVAAGKDWGKWELGQAYPLVGISMIDLGELVVRARAFAMHSN